MDVRAELGPTLSDVFMLAVKEDVCIGIWLVLTDRAVWGGNNIHAVKVVVGCPSARH